MSILMNLPEGVVLPPRRLLLAAGGAVLLLAAASSVAFAQGGPMAGVGQHLMATYHSMFGCPGAMAS